VINKRRRLPAMNVSCVYNTWRSQWHRWQLAVKPDIGQESRILTFCLPHLHLTPSLRCLSPLRRCRKTISYPRLTVSSDYIGSFATWQHRAVGVGRGLQWICSSLCVWLVWLLVVEQCRCSGRRWKELSRSTILSTSVPRFTWHAART